MLKSKRLKKLVYQSLTSECAVVSDFSLAPARASMPTTCDLVLRKVPASLLMSDHLLVLWKCIGLYK